MISSSSQNSTCLTDSQIRSLAINHIADEFLNVDEKNIETRTYMMKSTLPTVVIALENLLKEMQKRNLAFDSIKSNIDVMNELEIDKPCASFDSLNFLGHFELTIAQFLYRHNPRYSDQPRSLYESRSNEIGVILEQRIKDMAAAREAKRISDLIAKKMEAEKLEQKRQAQLAEKKRQFTEFMALSFKLWIQSLCRKESGNIFRSEIVLLFN